MSAHPAAVHRQVARVPADRPPVTVRGLDRHRGTVRLESSGREIPGQSSGPAPTGPESGSGSQLSGPAALGSGPGLDDDAASELAKLKFIQLEVIVA
jgi:hypothetical protein